MGVCVCVCVCVFVCVHACMRGCVQFDLLEQLGFEGYAVLVNTSELQTHVLATGKGKSFHKLRQQASKPLENPFIGFVFSDEAGKVWVQDELNKGVKGRMSLS